MFSLSCLHTHVTKNNELGENINFTYYYIFNLHDLEIITKTNNLVIDDNFFSISSNPAKDKIEIKFESPFIGIMELINLYGYSYEKKMYSYSTIKEINVSHLKNGLYMIIMKDNKGKVYRNKLIIAK